MRIERRAHLRVEPNRPLLGHYPHYLGSVRNISVAGAFIESERPLLPGEKFPITFWLELEHTFEVEAVVRHVEPLRGMGVEFLNMSGEGIRFVCNYWDERRTTSHRIIPKQMILAEFPYSFGRVRDISPGGAFIEDERYIPPGQRVAFKLWLNSIDAIPIEGTIRRVEEGEGMGIQFESLSQTDYYRLCEFCGVPPERAM